MHTARVLFLFSTAVLSGCTVTPSSGPGGRLVDSQASIKVTSPDKKRQVGIDYALIDINKAILPAFASATQSSLAGGFGGGQGAAPQLPLGVGDVVQVAIFESQAGGLFIPADAGSRPGNYVTLPQQTIDRDGTISVPYAGRINALGRSPRQVQNQIESMLANRAIEPQVLLTKVSSRSGRVAVLGDVKNPTNVELSEAGDRVLDVVADAGGLSAPGEETYITLQRRGRSATIQYDHLVNTPAENIYLVPGDTVLVDRERRTYLAFGAAGLNGRFDFEESNLTVAEALAKAGGALDARANPEQMMLYRLVDRSVLIGLGVNVSKISGEKVPVIFRANLRDPATMFALQQFAMQDKDIFYIGNADSVEILKFLDILNSVTSSSSGVTSDIVGTRNAIRELKR
ncbi:polysaccharide biosynthesis/export family protein [Agrobacterium cavarae]|uniref:polysaccharide biosynthesis/export family protein n=1 Tax=Agrobacterium cavarae TaxID=2528239 RepID=UPI0028AD255C|nr:polysaccharide biosynthesis/export family protein [Agrobacterium cavarae]